MKCCMWLIVFLFMLPAIVIGENNAVPTTNVEQSSEQLDKAAEIDKFKSYVSSGKYDEALKFMQSLTTVKEFFKFQTAIAGIKTNEKFEKEWKQKFNDLKKIESKKACDNLKYGRNLDWLNTYRDGYINKLTRGEAYYYGDVQFPLCYYQVIQVIGKRQILVSRYCDEVNLLEACRPVTLLITHAEEDEYVTGQRLKKGNYVCHGTFTYQTAIGGSNTVYVLLDMQSFRDLAWLYYGSLKDNDK